MLQTLKSQKSESKTYSRRAALGIIGGALATPAFIRNARAAEVTLRLHHFLPPVANVHKSFFVPWAKALSEKTDGRLEIQIFPAMQLGGKAPQLAEQARNGIVDIAWSLPVYTPSRYPVAETLSLPFMVTTAEKTSVAMHTLMNEFGQNEYRGTRPLAFHVHGAGKFHMRDKPIRTAADLKGIKMRAPNQSFGELLKEMGSEPVFFPVTEMAVGLSNGVIDGTCLPYEVVPAFKLQELCSVHCEAEPGARGLYANSFALLMNEAKYESLPDDLRTALDEETGMKMSRDLGKAFDGFEKIGRSLCEKQGNEIVQIKAAEVETWRKKTSAVDENWMKVLDDAGHDGKAVMARLNELLDQA